MREKRINIMGLAAALALSNLMPGPDPVMPRRNRPEDDDLRFIDGRRPKSRDGKQFPKGKFKGSKAAKKASRRSKK